jgi:hypothetical protein
VTVVNRTDLQKSIPESDICKENEIVWINVKVNRWTKKRDNVAVDLFLLWQRSIVQPVENEQCVFLLISRISFY